MPKEVHNSLPKYLFLIRLSDNKGVCTYSACKNACIIEGIIINQNSLREGVRAQGNRCGHSGEKWNYFTQLSILTAYMVQVHRKTNSSDFNLFLFA